LALILPLISMISPQQSLALPGATPESMNKANKEMRAQTAVDLLNACILLINLEVYRYYKMKKEVWGSSSILTPRGMEEYEAHQPTSKTFLFSSERF
jgi:hypothetical protein